MQVIGIEASKILFMLCLRSYICMSMVCVKQVVALKSPIKWLNMDYYYF